MLLYYCIPVLDSTDTHGHLKTKKKTVMICDDERDVLLFFKLVLESRYNVILVGSGEECIDKVHRRKEPWE